MNYATSIVIIAQLLTDIAHVGPIRVILLPQTRSDKTNDQETHIRSVSYKIKSCPTDDSVSSGQGCGIELVTVDYQDKGVAYQITISRNPSSGAPVVKRGNVELTSQNGDPIVVDCFAIRRSSSSIQLYAPGGIISFQNGALLVRLDRIYTAKVRQLLSV